jgi:hypothetical protein
MQDDSLRPDADRTGASSKSIDPDPSPAGDLSFFQKIFSSFLGGRDPEHDKRRMLRQIAKELTKQHYKFFKPKGEEALPNMARFFYEIYRVVSPAQIILQNGENSGVLKSIIIDSFLSKEQIEIQERLSERSIAERAKSMQLKDLVAELKEDLVRLNAAFDDERTRQIDGMYGMLLNLLRFVNFDYYFLLKKFDSNLQDRNFNYKPKFEPINGEYVVEDLKDFLEVMSIIDLEADWQRLFETIKQYRNIDIVALEPWNKMLAMLRDMRKGRTFELVVKYMEKNPAYRWTSEASTERIVEPYLSRIKTQTDMLIQKIVQEKRNGKVDELANLVFGTAAISRMKNYTDKANVQFQKKMLGGYTRVQALNFLKAFLIDYVKKDLRELVDLLLVRGQWSTALSSQQLSEAFHELMAVSEDLLQFDDSLADDGELGLRMRNALNRSDRNKEELRAVRPLLKDVNDRAQVLINRSAQSLIIVGRNLKTLLDDYAKTPHEVIINWKEIESASEAPIKERFGEVYKKIYYFVQLMQFFATAN